MGPGSERALVLLLLLAACPGARASQSCLNKQQLLTTIRQLQQLLKGQETRFAEGIRSMKSRLAALQSSVIKVAPDAPPVSCPALDDPPDGKKFGSKYLVDHEVHFTCNPGFRLVGPSSVVCLANGTWTGEQPHCRDVSACSSQPCHHGGTCVEGVNQYRCICPPGKTGNRCQHQTQAAAPEGGVAGDPAFSRAPRCAQVEREQHCSCEAGFHLSGTSGGDSICQDVDECEIYGKEGRPRLCMHACVNTPGSYRCTCPSGYRILADGKSCEAHVPPGDHVHQHRRRLPVRQPRVSRGQRQHQLREDVPLPVRAKPLPHGQQAVSSPAQDHILPLPLSTFQPEDAHHALPHGHSLSPRPSRAQQPALRDRGWQQPWPLCHAALRPADGGAHPCADPGGASDSGGGR
ncbi:fibulin-7 isoform X1 [Meriones unguiculatus]|uniref:fibulin-7 isoform X1 n=1 Tax=Meriones unguiculatus TaxID=10047 RepID=UPI00293F0540|nr:fibulin-7 isoform X1 [Meriones unguiculatus]